MNSHIFVCVLLLALVNPIILADPNEGLAKVCEMFQANIKDGSFEKRLADFVICRGKVLGPELAAKVLKCWEKIPNNSKEDMAKICSDIKANAAKFAEAQDCSRKTAGDESKDKMMECIKIWD